VQYSAQFTANLTRKLTGSTGFTLMAGHSFPDTTYHFVFGDRFTDDRFKLSSFNHINTANANAPWNTYGQAGDNSIYSDSTASAVSDFSDIPGINSPQNLRLLRRTNGFGTNWDDTNAALISTDPLRFEVSGYCIMGQYCLGSIGGNNLELIPPANLVITGILPPINTYICSGIRWMALFITTSMPQ